MPNRRLLNSTFSVFLFSNLFETMVICLLIVVSMGHAWLPPQCEKHLLKHVGWVWPQRRNTQDWKRQRHILSCLASRPSVEPWVSAQEQYINIIHNFRLILNLICHISCLLTTKPSNCEDLDLLTIFCNMFVRGEQMLLISSWNEPKRNEQTSFVYPA